MSSYTGHNNGHKKPIDYSVYCPDTRKLCNVVHAGWYSGMSRSSCNVGSGERIWFGRRLGGCLSGVVSGVLGVSRAVT